MRVYACINAGSRDWTKESMAPNRESMMLPWHPSSSLQARPMPQSQDSSGGTLRLLTNQEPCVLAHRSSALVLWHPRCGSNANPSGQSQESVLVFQVPSVSSHRRIVWLMGFEATGPAICARDAENRSRRARAGFIFASLSTRYSRTRPIPLGVLRAHRTSSVRRGRATGMACGCPGSLTGGCAGWWWGRAGVSWSRP